jgi:hypothetical protein
VATLKRCQAPITTERGKQYFAVQCSNLECRSLLPFVENRPMWSWRESQLALDKLEGVSLRCATCARETELFGGSYLFVLGK